MGKLKLNLEDLKVESFATTPDLLALRGTVFGQDTQAPDPCPTTPGEGCTMNNDTCNACSGTSCPCPSEQTCSYQQTCQDTCNHGATYQCATVTDCNCFTNGYTCDNTCTSQGCTACGNVC